MKRIRVSDAVHDKLTRLLGIRMAKTGKTQTYNDVIDALIAQSMFVPAELLQNIDVAINADTQLSYTTQEELVEAAVGEMLQNLSEKRQQESLPKNRTIKKL